MKNMNKIMMILVAMLAITTAMTPAWGQTAYEFDYCYDVWRSPDWPKTTQTQQTHFFNFDNPKVTSSSLPSYGPWKLEFYENYNSSNNSTYGFNETTVGELKDAYNVTTVPVYKLYRKVNDNDQFVSYVVLCAYSSVNNADGHTAFLSKPVSQYSGGIGCLLSGDEHNYSDNLYITVNGDMKSGFPSEITTTSYTLQLNKNINNAGTVAATATSGISGNNPYTVNHNTTVSIQATASTGYHFVNWDDNETTNPRSITVTSNVTRMANFAINTYTLQLNKNINNAGTVAATATSGISGNNPYTVNHDTTVSIQATANTGYRFVNWDDNVATNPRSITVTSDVTRTANFVREYTITLSTNNNYGTVSITGTGVVPVPNNNGTYTVPAGTQVTVTANPNTGSHFVNWDGDQTLANPSRQITVNSDQNITANFDYKIYNVPNGWTVEANNESVNVTSGTTDGIQDGKTVKITPPANGKKILTVKVKNKTN